MRILVTFAVDAEFAPWRKLREFEKKQNGLVTLHSARIGAVEVNVLLTGVGGRSAWLEASKKIWDGDIDVCISSGLAGALRPEYQVGEVLVARLVRGRASEESVKSEEILVNIAKHSGARPVESFYTADRVILLASEKKKLGEMDDAVEMESREVLFEAAAFGAKVVAVRCISDSVDDDLPLDFNRATTASGEISVVRVFSGVAKNLSALPALIRFGQQSKSAAQKLCAFLDRYLESLALSVDSIVAGAVNR